MKRWICLGALALAACTASAADVPAEPPAAPSARARWVEVAKARELPALDAPARALGAPNSSAVLSAPLAVRVVRVRVKPGQVVAQNEPLLDVASPEVVRAAGQLVSASLRADSYQARRARLAPLVEQGLSRTAELIELDAALTLARAEREGARATLRAAGIADKAAQAMLDGDGSFTLRAPLAGMVTRVDARPGEVRDATAGALVEVTGDSVVQVEARFMVAPPANAAFVWEGQGGRIPLSLDALSPRAQAEDGARVGWLSPRDGARAPAPGSLGRVRIEVGADWVTVPTLALEGAEGSEYVITRKGEDVVNAPVRVIVRTSSTAVVTGLASGTLIAADARGSVP